MAYILTTDNLTKTYGDKVAAGNINIHIREGEIYGLIGRNGAGKTTIMRMISGLSSPTSGTYTYHGDKINGVGVLIESPGLYLKMTAFQNVKLKCLSMGIKDNGYVNSLLEQVGLHNVENKPVQNFSLGMKQRLGIAIALVGDPEFIILDEPINGLDPQGIVEMREIIGNMSRVKGITVIVSSHILAELSKVADSFGIIHEGKLLDEFTAEELNERCSKFTRILVSDKEKTAEILRKMNIDKFEIKEDHIKVFSEIEDTSEVIKTLVYNDVKVYELSVVQSSLEEYYLANTGGSEA
jgi:ABC-2 type transport system ATP-binding protein